MGGELLEYPAKTSYREGRAEGLKDGREEGVRDMIAKMLCGGMEPSKIAEICDIPLSLIKDVKDGMSISRA